MSKDRAEQQASDAGIKKTAELTTPPATRVPSRSSLKHIGGYFDRETVEKVAVLRARFDLDNLELLKRAIDELPAP